jgi:putative endonuclease
MASRSLNFYIGLSSNLHKRVWQHKNRIFDGFTCHYNINRLVYFENYEDVANAIDRERQLKRWSRAKKIALIRSMNPTWLDLSADWY